MARQLLVSDTIQGDAMTNRSTHAYDGPLALFLIGVRIHQPWRLNVVSQVIRAMPPMIAELERNKAAAAKGEEESLGYLGSRSTVDLTGTTTIQRWRAASTPRRTPGSRSRCRRWRHARATRRRGPPPPATGSPRSRAARPAGRTRRRTAPAR